MVQLSGAGSLVQLFFSYPLPLAIPAKQSELSPLISLRCERQEKPKEMPASNQRPRTSSFPIRAFLLRNIAKLKSSALFMEQVSSYSLAHRAESLGVVRSNRSVRSWSRR